MPAQSFCVPERRIQPAMVRVLVLKSIEAQVAQLSVPLTVRQACSRPVAFHPGVPETAASLKPMDASFAVAPAFSSKFQWASISLENSGSSITQPTASRPVPSLMRYWK